MPLTKVKIEFPIHVSNIKVDGKNQYQIKPLFFDLFSVVDRRFETALNRFQQILQKQYKGLELNSETLDKLNWFRFSPKVDFNVYDLEIPLGKKQDFKGQYGIATFKIKGIKIACLPRMNCFMFILAKDYRGKYNIQEQAVGVIKRLMVRYKDYEGEEYDIKNYTSTKKEFVNSFTSQFYVKPSELKFASQKKNPFFDMMFSEQKMEGVNEIWGVSKNLNHQYPTGLNRAFFQDEIVDRLQRILFNKPYKNTPIAIIGEEGVGKHTIVHEALSRYIKANKDPYREMWHLDPNRVITGMSIVGMWQKRMEAILSFVKNPYDENKGADIVLVDNVVSMLRVGQSGSNSMSVNDVLKPYLEKRIVQFIVIATPEEWKVIQEKDIRFSDLFQIIRLEQPDLETAVKMALENRKELELRFNSDFSVQAIQALFDLRRNYLRRKALPGSVIKIMRQLAIKFKNKSIDLEEIRSEFESLSGLDQDFFDAARPLEKDEIHQSISAKLVGQESANQTLTNVIHTMKARLNNPRRPLGSFLFIGPTGVGKTQAAKVLCKYLTGNENQLLKFDMNEYIDYYAVERLIGSPTNPDGILTGKVRFRPFGVILLDEIEKAHIKVHDILLQILDDARLTDSLGRTVDFSNTIIIMTSNIGAQDISSQVGFTKNETVNKDIYRKAVEKEFRPEFINRIDDIVVFNPLSLEHILDIAKLQINELLARDGFVRRTTILNISSDALEWVANRGFDEQMGGRALKRQIEKDLTALTAEQLVGTYSKNPILFEIQLKKGKLVPSISKLELVEPLEKGWFPQLPDKKGGSKFYNSLIKKLKKLAYKLDDTRDEMEDPFVDVSKSRFFLFKLNLSEIQENITNLSLAFNDRNFSAPPAIPLRLKLINPSTFIGSGQLMDILFQSDGKSIINEAFSHTTPTFNSLDTEFINSYLDVAILMLSSKEFIKNKEQKVLLSFQSCIVDVGEEQIKYLSERFAMVFEDLNIEYKVHPKNHNIEIEGYNLINLLYGEQGIHLFQVPFQNPIPIRLVLKKNNRTISKGLENTVVRFYNEKIIIDLKTWYSNPVDISSKEFKLMIYGGIK